MRSIAFYLILFILLSSCASSRNKNTIDCIQDYSFSQIETHYDESLNLELSYPLGFIVNTINTNDLVKLSAVDPKNLYLIELEIIPLPKDKSLNKIVRNYLKNDKKYRSTELWRETENPVRGFPNILVRTSLKRENGDRGLALIDFYKPKNSDLLFILKAETYCGRKRIESIGALNRLYFN
ncbi:hypothetical protein BBFL7_01145 [Flavobacteria bacterium BBFL7]|nr:hypothetical protein BBFL7_01145 [Flavobacteria bacterium BBFL7]